MTDAPSSNPMQFGPSLEDPSAFYFYFFLIAAMIIVVMFCRTQFQQFSVEENNDDYVAPLLPRYLATPEEYSKGFFIYAGTMLFAIFLLSFLNTDTLRGLGVPLPKSVSNAAIPLIGALTLIGILPNVPVLQEIEKWLRRYAHERAFIPSSARAMADKLSTADFDFSAYAGQEVLLCAEMRGVDQADFAMPRRSLEYSWARLSCLAYELDRRRTSGDLDPLDGELLRRYAKHLDGIGAQRRTLETQLAEYRKAKSSFAGYTDYALHRSIQDTLYRLYVLLGCAVRTNLAPDGDVNLALQQFGFKLNRPIPPSDSRIVTIGALFMVTTAVLLVGYAAVGLNILAGHLKLQPFSDFFPRALYQPLVDTTSSVILYGSAIVAAGLLRAQAMRANAWFTPGAPARRPSAAKYLLAASVGAGAGFVGTTVWGIVFNPITINGLKLAAPYALLAAAAGGFWVYHLDNAKLQQRPARWREIGVQSAVTGLFGLIAAAASFALLLGDAAPALDLIVLTGLTNAVIGGLLAWHVPTVAAATTSDPLAKAREERIKTLEAAAFDRFGDAAAVDRWMGEPQPALGDRSPKAAAADIEGFEQAMNLLQGPLALAA